MNYIAIKFTVLNIHYCRYRLQEPGMHQDVTFCVHGRKIPVHRCILSARSSYFADLFHTRWKNRKDIVLKHKMVTICIDLS